MNTALPTVYFIFSHRNTNVVYYFLYVFRFPNAYRNRTESEEKNSRLKKKKKTLRTEGKFLFKAQTSHRSPSPPLLCSNSERVLFSRQKHTLYCTPSRQTTAAARHETYRAVPLYSRSRVFGSAECDFINDKALPPPPTSRPTDPKALTVSCTKHRAFVNFRTSDRPTEENRAGDCHSSKNF